MGGMNEPPGYIHVKRTKCLMSSIFLFCVACLERKSDSMFQSMFFVVCVSQSFNSVFDCVSAIAHHMSPSTSYNGTHTSTNFHFKNLIV
jgi:hypothetical protein